MSQHFRGAPTIVTVSTISTRVKTPGQHIPPSLIFRPGAVFDPVCPSPDLCANPAVPRMWSGDPCEIARPFQEVFKVETILIIILQHYLPFAQECFLEFSKKVYLGYKYVHFQTLTKFVLSTFAELLLLQLYLL